MKRFFVLAITVMVLPATIFSQDLKGIDEIAPFSEGLAAVRQGNQWGFINEEGALVIDFRSDLHWNENADVSQSDIRAIRYPIFKEGRCMIKKFEYEIPIYGFIDTKGKTVIEPQFLNITPFNNGYATGVLFEKVFLGKNEIKLDMFDFKFHDILVDTTGKIEEFFGQRDHIQMSKRRYELPTIGSKMLSDGLIAVRTKNNGWEIRKLIL